MFIFIKKIFYIGFLCLSSLVSATPLNAIPLSCISLKNQECKVRPKIVKNYETRHIKWHETCKCICRLDKIICNSKQRWNEDKCRCECKELINKGVCDKGYV